MHTYARVQQVEALWLITALFRYCKTVLLMTHINLHEFVYCCFWQHHIASYFEHSTSDYQVELLRENEDKNLEELPENEEEEAMTGVQEMDLST